MKEAADLSLLANNYMETRLLRIPGVSKGLPHLDEYRMEMTRYSLGELTEETGGHHRRCSQPEWSTTAVDAFWMSHEPWFIPEPFTPEAGEDVVGRGPGLLDRCHSGHLRGGPAPTPDLVKTAPPTTSPSTGVGRERAGRIPTGGPPPGGRTVRKNGLEG